jgi:YHS domain-containing protein
MSRQITLSFVGLSLVLGLLIVAGCGRTSDPTPPASPDVAVDSPQSVPADDGEHQHKPGAHGGTLISIGLDSYHAEAVFDSAGELKLFMLGQDETRVMDVESQTLVAYVKVDGQSRASEVSLEPRPQPGDAEGRTSLFVGKLPEELASDLANRAGEVTIPSITISGERFRVAFTIESHDSGHGDAMPAAVGDAEERELFLTAAGRYTEADIAANGFQTASQKFKGFKASHDLSPKAGDKICPITLTKANSQCTWIVGGKEYEFCCPPCVTEFVMLAKEDGDIKEPEDYIKQ